MGAILPFSERGMMVGWRARAARTAIGITQKDAVAQLRDNGFEASTATYSKVESGKVEIMRSAAWIVALAELYEVTTTYLLGLTEDPLSWVPDAPMRVVPKKRARTQ